MSNMKDLFLTMRCLKALVVTLYGHINLVQHREILCCTITHFYIVHLILL